VRNNKESGLFQNILQIRKRWIFPFVTMAILLITIIALFSYFFSVQ